MHLTNIKDSDFFNLILEKNYRLGKCFGDPAGYQVQASVGIGEAEIFYQMTGKRVFSVREK